MGAFIAALRKANGLTQRELADKLNVSDKAVSRWERDENAPDIMLIPVIAEIFGVTSDELLKGERITKTASEDSQKQNQKIEKQIKTLAIREVTRFKSMCMISMALSLIGVIILFVISYGCRNQVIGFSVNALLAFVGAVITFLGLMQLQNTVQRNEIFENADKSITKDIIVTKINFSFAAIYIAIVSILLGLPFIINGDLYTYVERIESFRYVVSFTAYMFICVPFIIIAAVLLLCVGYPLYRCVIFKYKEPIPNMGIIKLDITQFVISVVAIICCEILFRTRIFAAMNQFDFYSKHSTWTESGFVSSGFDYSITPIITIICGILIIAALLVSIGVIPFFAIKAKENSKLVILSGCRNAALLLDIILVIFLEIIVSDEDLSGVQGVSRYLVTQIYNPGIILLGVLIAAAILIAYFVLKNCFSPSSARKRTTLK